jgi:hypothetical protein
MTTDATQTAAAATVSAVGAQFVGLPPPVVIACAVIGAVIHVWFTHSRDFTFSVRWVTVVAGLVLAYSAFGVLGSTIIVSIGHAPIPAGQAPDGVLVGTMRELCRFLALAPMWAIAGALSVSAGALLPWIKGWLGRRAKSDHGGAG